MKKNFLFSVALFSCINVFSQSYSGYRSSNYNGVNGVIFNPSSIADNRYRWDVNLFGLNAGVSNNTASFNFKTFSKFSDNNIDSILLDGTKDQFSAAANIDILGPSVMFRIKKVSLALTSRFRTLVNAQDIDTKLIQSINSNTDDITFPYSINSDKNQKINANAFMDLGISAAMVLYSNQQHLLKGGISAKYLSGISNSFVNINNIHGTVDEDLLPPNDAFITNATGRIALGQGGIDIDNVDGNDIFSFKSSGVGADVGLTYEFRPNFGNKTAEYQNKYKVKVGLALLDLGTIKYEKSPDQYNADYTLKVPNGNKLYLKDFEDKSFNEIKTYLDNSPYFTNNSTNANSYSVSLPTTLQANVDYNIYNNFYADVSGQVSLTKKTSNTNSFHPNSITVTPRYENKIVGVYLPLNYNAISNFNAGFGLRAGPLYVGSGSVFNLMFGDSKQADVYIGFHIGGLYKRKKEKEPIFIEDVAPTVTDTVVISKVVDTDGDGITDNEDKCPAIVGLAKYKGCPIPDTDNDGINDEEDKCPSVAGIAKYNGCPIPDTDGDGVNDEEDKCPTVAGSKNNFGCPEIKEEVIKKVNYAASHLLFATGKSKILPASYPSLNVLAAILETDKTLKLRIDGHTDNVGKPEKNQLLSEARANAAKMYLVGKGIPANRIETNGYGDTKPVADNKNPAGRAKNRRVEMQVYN